MATYVIQVLEPGKKNRKMYAGNGALTTKWIHAKQYRTNEEKPLSGLQEWIDELNRDNPNYQFDLKEITGTGHDMYAPNCGVFTTLHELAEIDNKLKALATGY